MAHMFDQSTEDTTVERGFVVESKVLRYLAGQCAGNQGTFSRMRDKASDVSMAYLIALPLLIHS
jgi:hypothetical protein